MIILETSYGPITLELDFEKTPVTAENFLQYAKDGYYEKSIFHRVINGFMIQGGGFDVDMKAKKTRPPIKNEASQGGQNKRGTIAMARTSDPHSASAQFFINVADNDFLNFRSESESGWGYCVFGRVVDGMDVIDKIKSVSTTNRAGHQDVPVNSIEIQKVIIKDSGEITQ